MAKGSENIFQNNICEHTKKELVPCESVWRPTDNKSKMGLNNRNINRIMKQISFEKAALLLTCKWCCVKRQCMLHIVVKTIMWRQSGVALLSLELRQACYGQQKGLLHSIQVATNAFFPTCTSTCACVCVCARSWLTPRKPQKQKPLYPIPPPRGQNT